MNVNCKGVGALVLFVALAASWSCACANEIENRFIAVGLVNADPEKNFFRLDLYQGLSRAYLQPVVARKLADAQRLLQQGHPGYSLQILDAARPRSVSRIMFERMKGTKFERFVANPAKGSMHNYGIAVDVTIVDTRGKELDMGISPFKRSTSRIYWDYALTKLGKAPSESQLANRQLLADTMVQAGFIPLRFEWWHFNGMAKETVRRTLKIIE